MPVPRVVFAVRKGVMFGSGGGTETRERERRFVKKLISQARQLVYPFDYFYELNE